jgi:hypothetical protein
MDEVIKYSSNLGTFWIRYSDATLHRLDGPAIEWVDGRKEYYQDGKLHRVGAPAVICADGAEEYYQDGKLHRTDGPAICWLDKNGNKILLFYQHGLYHREDGPAISYLSMRRWALNGKLFENEQQFQEKLAKIRE